MARHHYVTSALAIVLAAMVLPANRATAAADGGPRITVVFRYDDYSAASQRDVDEHVIALFRKHNCPFTVGVIPFISADLYPPTDGEEAPSQTGEHPLTAEKFEPLLVAAREGALEVAQHGCTHKNRVPGKHAPQHSEFAGLSPQAQFIKIERGKRHLEKLLGKPIRTFIPPFNGYDQSTIAALDQLGFTVLSAGMFGSVVPTRDLRFAPQSCSLPNLKTAVSQLQRRAQDALVIAIFHPQDLRETDRMPNPYGLGKFTSLPELDALLQWLGQQPNVAISTLAEAVAAEHDAGSERLAAWIAYRESPWRWALIPTLQPHVRHYPTRAESRRLWCRAVLLLCLYVLGVSSLVAVGVWGLGRLSRGILAGKTYIGLLALLGSIAATALLAIKLAPIGYKDITLIASLPGIATGLLLCARARKAGPAQPNPPKKEKEKPLPPAEKPLPPAEEPPPPLPLEP